MSEITDIRMEPSPPPFRWLRGYAFDPSLSTTLDTAGINQTTFAVTWEKLEPGPVGEYIEVVDHDPASGRLYEPVDLDHRHVLAQNGLAPSESSPQSHQQMVYAVAMTTIGHFEQALGRVALWSSHRENESMTPQPTTEEIRVAMAGNLCRCGAYPKIERAILRAAEAQG